MDLFTYITIGLVAAAAGFIKSGFAIGAGIFLTPVLAQIMDARMAVALVAPMMLFTDLTAIYQYWAKWRWKDVLALAPLCLLGGVGGAFLLNSFSSDQAQDAIALVGLAYIGLEVFRYFWTRNTPGAKSLGLAPVIGLLAGLASTLANAGGVFLSTYLARRLPKEAFVGTTVLVFFGLNIVKVSMFSGLGLLTGRLWLIDLALIPLMFGGGVLGKALNRRIDDAVFTKWLLVLITLACIRLLVV
jgi:hypothetical protein